MNLIESRYMSANHGSWLLVCAAAGVMTVAIIVLASWNPSSPFTWALIAGVLVFAVASWFQPALWYRRTAGGLLMVATSLAALPSIDAQFQFADFGKWTIVHENASWGASLFVAAAVVCMLFDFGAHHSTKQRPRKSESTTHRGRPPSIYADRRDSDASCDTAEASVAVTTKTSHSHIELTIDQDFDEWTGENEERLSEAIRQLLKTDQDVRIVRTRRGSVKVTIELSPRDAEKLFWAVKRGDLARVDAVDAEMADGVLLSANLDPNRDAARSVNPLPVWKRAFDLSVAVVGLIFLAPVFVTIALVVRLTSRGPVLYKQVRSGVDGREFTIYKFRTMVVNAEDYLSEIREHNKQAGPVFRIQNDPRVTPMGGYLRETGLDELPQILNVIKGDMSFVGPRPLPADEWIIAKDEYKERESIVPGVTSEWYVQGSNSMSFADWMRHDLAYIRSRTLRRDLVILAKSVGLSLFRMVACVFR